MATLSDIPNGGWRRELGGEFDNALDARVLTGKELGGAHEDVLSYYVEYAERNFAEAFLPGMGSEEILWTLARCGRRPRWLDVGAGTSSWFWALAVDVTDRVCFADVRVEPLMILEAMASRGSFSPAYAQAASFIGLPEDSLPKALGRPRSYALFDASSAWPASLGRFDLVTMIGLCGLRTRDVIYDSELAGAREHLAGDGLIVGVDWRRSAEFARLEGHDNAFVSPALLEERASRLGLEVVRCATVDIASDPLYDSLMFWVIRCREEVERRAG